VRTVGWDARLFIIDKPLLFSLFGIKTVLCHLNPVLLYYIMPSAYSKGSKHIETRTEGSHSSVPS
jgi:hypothetical protein